MLNDHDLISKSEEQDLEETVSSVDDIRTDDVDDIELASDASSILEEIESDDNSSVNDPIDDFDSDEYQPDSQLSPTALDSTLMDMEQNCFLNQPLYAGSTVSVIQSVASHLMWFTSHPNISKDAFSDMLWMEHSSTLPSGNLLPCSYTDLLKLVEPYLIKPVIFHCCPKDCVVFRGKYVH